MDVLRRLFQNCSGIGAAANSNQQTQNSTVAPSPSPSPTPSPSPSPSPNSVAPNIVKSCSSEPAGDYEAYNLTAIKSLPASVTAVTNYSQVPGSGGYNGVQRVDSCRLQTDGFLNSHGQATLRVEVDPGDDPLELGENTERAETYSFQDVNGKTILESSASGTQYYAMSYYFPSNWGGTQYPWSAYESGSASWPGNTTSDCSSGSGNECNSWSYVAQFHAASPPWGFLGAAQTSVGGTQQLWFGSSNGSVQLGAIALGKWTDLVLEINWQSGAITAWRRDEGSTAFTQVGSYTDSSASSQTGVYFKQGLYRGGAVNGRTDILYIGPAARGSSFAAVELAAFGTSNGP